MQEFDAETEARIRAIEEEARKRYEESEGKISWRFDGIHFSPPFARLAMQYISVREDIKKGYLIVCPEAEDALPVGDFWKLCSAINEKYEINSKIEGTACHNEILEEITKNIEEKWSKKDYFLILSLLGAGVWLLACAKEVNRQSGLGSSFTDEAWDLLMISSRAASFATSSDPDSAKLQRIIGIREMTQNNARKRYSGRDGLKNRIKTFLVGSSGPWKKPGQARAAVLVEFSKDFSDPEIMGSSTPDVYRTVTGWLRDFRREGLVFLTSADRLKPVAAPKSFEERVEKMIMKKVL